MLRKLIIILVCTIGATNAMAQNGSSKTTEKANDPKIDYKQMGAPLPSFILLPFHDTSTKPVTAEQVNKASEMTAKEKRAAKKKEKEIKEAKMANAKKLYTEKDFDNGANLFIMMFNPTCSHCTNETENLEKHIALFKRSKILLIANPNMKPYLPNFVKQFHTDDYTPTISVGMDSSGFMNNVFLYQALPQINVYSGDRKLIRTFTGDVSIDSLQKYIQ